MKYIDKTVIAPSTEKEFSQMIAEGLKSFGVEVDDDYRGQSLADLLYDAGVNELEFCHKVFSVPFIAKLGRVVIMGDGDCENCGGETEDISDVVQDPSGEMISLRDTFHCTNCGETGQY